MRCLSIVALILSFAVHAQTTEDFQGWDSEDDSVYSMRQEAGRGPEKKQEQRYEEKGPKGDKAVKEAEEGFRIPEKVRKQKKKGY